MTANSACWQCPGCGLTTDPFVGPLAAREAVLLAAAHDQIHHRGSATARVLVSPGDR